MLRPRTPPSAPLGPTRPLWPLWPWLWLWPLWLLLALAGRLGPAGLGRGQVRALQAGFRQGQAAQTLQTFNGNDSQQLDQNHFKLLELIQGDSLLLGARNVVYNLSLTTMREQRRLEWPPSEEDVRMCKMKGKSSEQCQNFVRVLKMQDPETLLVCGTNAYKPRCRTYLVTTDAYELVSETPGEGACPYQENGNVTSLFADGELYSATATQFSGIDALIHRRPLRTEQFNPKQLNAPNFVSSFRYGDHAYFLFREIAIEHINCGKIIYSRIGRVCLSDSGGSSRSSRERWTSFAKARLNCSITGDFPFYFDEIQAASGVVASAYQQAAPLGALPPTSPPNQEQQDILYAVFTTPPNSIGGSAVCAYRMADVLAAFEGPFKAQADSNSNWLPVAESRVPQQPRPGTCANDSKRLPDEHINFIRDNPLMDVAVEPIWSQPIVTMASISFRFTQVAVDVQVETAEALGGPLMRTDVIFVATDDGRVFKLINTYHLRLSGAVQRFLGSGSAPAQQPVAPYPPLALQPATEAFRRPLAAAQVMSSAARQEPVVDLSASTVVVEELHLFDARTPIISMLLLRPTTSGAGKLVVLSARQLKAVPLARCERATTCVDCLALHDPYCAWDMQQQVCLAAGRSALGAQAQSQAPARFAGAWPRAGRQWFPANSLGGQPTVQANNHTLGWWASCPASELLNQPTGGQQVGAPFRSLFSSHLQVPSRFDYQSGHHLSHTALVALTAGGQQQQGASSSANFRPQPVSECLTFCGGAGVGPGGLQASPGADRELEGSGRPGSCADYLQAHYLGGLQLAGQSLYTSENLYLAVIIFTSGGLLVGLLLGFVLCKSVRHNKRDSSVCSSTFDETNLYMASTGSHHGHAGHLFAQHQQQQARLLLSQNSAAGQLSNGALRNGALFEPSQCLLGAEPTSGYGGRQQQQQMLLQLAQQQQPPPPPPVGAGSPPIRTGCLPPLPPGAQQPGQGPLVNTSTSNTTLINHSQLTPNVSSGASSTTGSSGTSATAPANEQHNQLYLNQSQLLGLNSTAKQPQRNFSGGKAGAKLAAGSGAAGQQFNLQPSNKIYL